MTKTKRMWAGGPLRFWSSFRGGGCRMPMAEGGFGGAYVCERCLVPVAGVYRVSDGVQGRQSWLCASCKTESSAKDVLADHVADSSIQPQEWQP
jgi:hypothetical protein